MANLLYFVFHNFFYYRLFTLKRKHECHERNTIDKKSIESLKYAKLL